MTYYSIVDNKLFASAEPPPAAKLFKHQLKLLLPPLVTELHQAFRAWGVAGLSPGPVLARRIYFNKEGTLAFHFLEGARPKSVKTVGGAPDLAAWLVLLDKWIETFVVLARARTVWSPEELTSALTFLTPAYLPDKLVAHPPDNWESVAQALALIVADGPLVGRPTNQHWQEKA
jgi:hypothetical protein